MASTGGGWTQLRQQARSLETQTDTLFHTYSQFSSSTTVGPKASEEELRTETQIEELLVKRDQLIAQLTRLLDSEAALTASALKQSNLARHREVLSDHRKEFARIKSTITDARNRASLLSNVRSDIEQYRSQNPAQAEADYMLDERRRIDNSHNMTDSVLSQAFAVSEAFNQQRETLASINRRIVHAAGQVPGINQLIGKISTKKRRDGIILGVFIAVCVLFFYFLS